MKVRQWYRFQNSASDPSVAELLIYDDIGKSYWNDNAVTALQFIDDLNGLGPAVSKVSVRVNSLGGDVFEAVAIANALRTWASANGRSVETSVEGIAASAASIVIMAGSTIRIGDNAMVMIHEPWSVEIGNSTAFRKMADTLDAIRGTIVATYKWHSELDSDAIVALMQAETWFDADGAIANGFATEKVQGLAAAAKLTSHVVSNLKVPEKFKARVDALLTPADPAPVAAAASEVLSKVSAAGLDLAFATALVSAGLPMDQVSARIETAKADKAKATTRATEINALCATAKQEKLAAGWIAGTISVKEVQDTLTDFTAQLDAKTTIDASLQPESGKAKVKIDTAAIYAARNKR